MPAALSQETLVSIAWPLMILAIAVTAGVFGIVAVRRKMRGPSDSFGPEGFTLAGLQKMHRQGLISDEEYEQMRHRVIQDVKTGLDATNMTIPVKLNDTNNSAKPPGQPPDESGS